MKKFLAIIMSITMLLCMMLPMASALTPAEEAKLQFNEDGKFKILNVSDIQDDANLSSLTKKFLRAAIESENPDLILLTGDNIGGHLSAKSAEKGIRQFMDIFEEYGIPVGIVFGNHDAQSSGLSREQQMAVYNSYKCSVSYDDGEALDGCGTYNIPIYASADDTDVVFNCWMFDSGDYAQGGGYDHVKQSQLDWYKAKSAELKAANGGEVVPSLAFQHIIVPEIFDALVEVPAGTAGAISKYGKNYVLPETASEDSILGEGPCPSAENGSEFAAFLEMGDVLGIVSGHDHVNSFVVPYQGIDLINTPTCGFKSYGNEETRGVRVIELTESNPAAYETRIVKFFDVVNTDDTMTMFTYKLLNFFNQIVAYFSDLWNNLSSLFQK